MAQYTKQQLISASNAAYFTNVYGGISASAVRDLNDSWISSSALLSGSNTFIGNQIISGTMTAQLPANYIWLGDSNGYNQAVATSSISLQGAQGIQGLQGLQGTQGIQGITGLQGLQGLQGIQGLQGTQGIQGITGLQGIQGIQGASGSQGIQGLQGLQGLQGIQGVSGSQGTQGIQGLQGLQGIQGTNGLTGSNGAQGTQGIQGIQGADNSTQGTQGVQGLQGLQGLQGIQGISGSNGAQGIQGIQGADNSTQGTQGAQGFTGAQGIQGITGISGSNGTQGAQGIQGVQGTQGDNVSSGSLLVTASFASTNITFTKGDATTFNLPGFATTGSNSFNGNQTITGSLIVSGGAAIDLRAVGYYHGGARLNLGDFENATFSNLNDFLVTFNGDAKFFGDNIILDGTDASFVLKDTTAPSYLAYAMRNKDAQLQFIDGIDNKTMVAMTTASVDVNTNINISGSLTASLQQGYAWVGDSNNRTTLVATSSFGGGGSIDTGSFATTGSNTFTGNQTLVSSSIAIQGSGNLSFPNGLSFSGNSGDISSISATSTIQLITEPPAGPGGEGNSIKFINRVSSSFISFDNQQAGAGNPINFTGGAAGFTLNVVSGSTGKLNINAQGGIDATNSTFTASLANGYVWVGNGSNYTTVVATSSFGGSTDTGSLLVTASFASNDITFTKGDATTFKLRGFATTGSNSFNGDQNVTGSIKFSGQLQVGSLAIGPTIQSLDSGTPAGNTSLQVNAGPSGSFSLRTLYGAGVGKALLEAYDTFPSYTTFAKIEANSNGSMKIEGSAQVSITGSALSMQGFTYPTTDGTNGQVLTTNGSKVLTFTTITGSGGSINTGSFATTGSNNFVGVETINNLPGTSVGEVYLLGRSGSLILSNTTGTPTYASLNHLSSSTTNGNTNIIFKTNGNSADTIISGSNNIFTNPTAPTAGFKRYIGGNGSLMLSPSSVNQISASQAFPITTQFNIHTAGAITTRAAVSASQWTIGSNMLIASLNIGSSAANNAEKILGALSINQNQVGNAVSIIANRTAISASTNITANAFIGGATTLTMASSSISYTANVGNASITNGFQNAGGASTNNSLQVSQNWFGGTVISVSGSDAGGLNNPRVLYNNYLFSGFNEFGTPMANLSLNGSGSSMVSTIAMGQELGITGSNGLDANNFSLIPGIGAGSAFFGRWNSQSGNRARTAETVFAIGTGTSTSLTKTGFLIDSGSNTFIEGTLNVSGSTTMTGSLTISSSATYDLIVKDSMVVSGSNGAVYLTPAGFRTANTGTDIASYVNQYSIAQSNTTTADELGFTLDTDAYGVSGWSGPAIYGNDPSDLYPAFLGFQNKSTWTDGRVSVLTPLAVSGSLIANSYTILTSVSASLNFADDTAAAAGGVPLGGLYRNGNFVMIRLT